MFKPYRLSSRDEIEFYPHDRPTIRGIGAVIPCHIDPRYVLYWKKLSRDEGFELMKKYQPFAVDFVIPRRPFNGGFCYDIYYSTDYIVLVNKDGTPTSSVYDKDMPQPIRLWKERGYSAWVKERIDIMLDKWQGAEPAMTTAEWIDQCTDRTKTAGILIDFQFQLWLHATESLKANKWLRELFETQKHKLRSRINRRSRQNDISLAVMVVTNEIPN